MTAYHLGIVAVIAGIAMGPWTPTLIVLILDLRWRRERAAEDAFRTAQREADARRYADDGSLR